GADQARPRVRRPVRRRRPPGDRPRRVHGGHGVRRRRRGADHARAPRPLRADGAAGGDGREPGAGGLDEHVGGRAARRPGRPGARRGPRRRCHGGRVRRAGPRRAARGDPPGDPADRQRRLLRRGRGVPPRGRPDRAGRAGSDAAPADARPLVAHGRPDRLRAGGARRPGVRRARRAAQRHGAASRDRSAGRAGPGDPHAVQPAGPGGHDRAL
ncbi:MAG: FIG01121405: hypothetical protein, partial [uncultured Blastococcus sp.]